MNREKELEAARMEALSVARKIKLGDLDGAIEEVMVAMERLQVIRVYDHGPVVSVAIV